MRELHKVVIKDKEYEGESHTYHIESKDPLKAGKIALTIHKKERPDLRRPYILSINFECYIDNEKITKRVNK